MTCLWLEAQDLRLTCDLDICDLPPPLVIYNQSLVIYNQSLSNLSLAVYIIFINRSVKQKTLCLTRLESTCWRWLTIDGYLNHRWGTEEKNLNCGMCQNCLFYCLVSQISWGQARRRQCWAGLHQNMLTRWAEPSLHTTTPPYLIITLNNSGVASCWGVLYWNLVCVCVCVSETWQGCLGLPWTL